MLARRGHDLRTSSDTETLVHLWEDHGEELFPHLRGQFAFSLFDRRRRRMILARDRMGICPLFWTIKDDWLLFGSEIQALLASGMIVPKADPLGLDNIFTFFGMPGRRTAFAGINAVPPGCFLSIRFSGSDEAARVEEKTYWDFEFPDHGDEFNPRDEASLREEFDATFEQATRLRMRADVPVAAYLSGGVDSAMVVSKCRTLSSDPIPTFTARVRGEGLDESDLAAQTAADLGCKQTMVDCDPKLLGSLFPKVIVAADCPVVDTNAGALFALSRAVHDHGYKVVLSGEGADEALGGYVWFKIHKFARLFGIGGFQPTFSLMRQLYHHRFHRAPPGEYDRINRAVGGMHAQTFVYHGTSAARWRLLTDEMRSVVQQCPAYDQLGFDTRRIQRWHPLNQSLYFSYKTHLPGLLLNHRGDRTAMANSVEVRYPFLDEKVVELCAKIHPRWKLRGLRGDKHLLRRTAMQTLPKATAMRAKTMFRSPFAETLLNSSQSYVPQLLSRESLERTPYFDAPSVLDLLEQFETNRYPRVFRLFIEMALSTVVGTQLWHHLYLGGGLCDLPTWTAPDVPQAVVARI